MPGDAEGKYLWVMEWLDPFDQPPSTAIDAYTLEVLPGMKEEEFEKFMVEELFPAVGDRPTRRAHVAAHYLFKYDGAVRDPLSQIFGIYVREEGLREKFQASVASTSVGSFTLVGKWGEKPTVG